MHTVKATSANVHGMCMMPEPSHGENETVNGDSGYVGIKKREYAKSSIQANVEHVFGVEKGLLKFKKTRYRGRQKQTAKVNILFTLVNLVLADSPCIAT